MILIDGTEFLKCGFGFCADWCPIDDMRWDDELLDWVCPEHVSS